MGKITFADDAWEEYLFWQSANREKLKRINDLLREVQRTPFSGTGKPEHLKGSRNWSRRIDSVNRLVYEVLDGEIVVKQCRGHYDDN